MIATFYTGTWESDLRREENGDRTLADATSPLFEELIGPDA